MHASRARLSVVVTSCDFSAYGEYLSIYDDAYSLIVLGCLLILILIGLFILPKSKKNKRKLKVVPFDF